MTHESSSTTTGERRARSDPSGASAFTQTALRKAASLAKAAPKPIRTAVTLLSDAIARFTQDRGPLVAAALAFYGLLSLGPTVVIVTELVALFLGERDAQALFGRQLTIAIGSTGAAAVERLANELEARHDRPWGFLGIAVFLYAATRVFASLQDALNQIWNVRPSQDRKLKYRAWYIIKNRIRSLLIVGLLGVILLLSLLATTMLEAITTYLPDLLATPLTWRTGGVVASLSISTLIFAVIYKSVPDARVEWRYVWPGALLGGVLFAAGKLALGWHIGSRQWGSVNETATALLVVLIWASYSANVFLFGAEFAEAWCAHSGGSIEPYDYAVRTNNPRPSASSFASDPGAAEESTDGP